MKNHFYLSLFITLSAHVACTAQKSSELLMDTIWVTTNKTTAIIFPETIGKFDIGSEEFGAEKYLKTLTIRVASAESPPTSILVIYGERIYHGTLAYKANPKKLFLDFSNQVSSIPQFPNETRVKKANDSLKNLEAQMIEKRMNIVMSETKASYKTIVTNNESIFLTLFDMITDNDNLYIKFLFINKSKLPYTIDFVEFTYRDPSEEKGLKGTYENKPVYPLASNKIDQIDGKEQRFLGYAIPRYALSKKGELMVVVREKSGSRSLKLTVPFTEILESRTINKR